MGPAPEANHMPPIVPPTAAIPSGGGGSSPASQRYPSTTGCAPARKSAHPAGPADDADRDVATWLRSVKLSLAEARRGAELRAHIPDAPLEIRVRTVLRVWAERATSDDTGAERVWLIPAAPGECVLAFARPEDSVRRDERPPDDGETQWAEYARGPAVRTTARAVGEASNGAPPATSRRHHQRRNAGCRPGGGARRRLRQSWPTSPRRNGRV